MTNRKFEMDIRLNVYDLHEQNEMLYPIGLGMYHSGVEIMGREWSFASGSGIYPGEPRQAGGAKFRESLLIGKYKGTTQDVDSAIGDLRPQFGGDSYHVLEKNCNAFSYALVLRLLNVEIPGFVNRMANFGSIFSCLLPPEMTGKAPVGDSSAGSYPGRPAVYRDASSASASARRPPAFSGQGSRLSSGTGTGSGSVALRPPEGGTVTDSGTGTGVMDGVDARRQARLAAAQQRMGNSFSGGL